MIRQAISPRLAISTLSNIGIRQTPLPRKLPEGGFKGKAGFGRALAPTKAACGGPATEGNPADPTVYERGADNHIKRSDIGRAALALIGSKWSRVRRYTVEPLLSVGFNQTNPFRLMPSMRFRCVARVSEPIFCNCMIFHHGEHDDTSICKL